MNYSDADYTGCRVDRKSTSESCQFLRNYSISWSSKNQNFMAISTVKAEYVAVGACCAQVLWMKHTLIDYDLNYDHMKIYCDNTSIIHMIKMQINIIRRSI